MTIRNIYFLIALSLFYSSFSHSNQPIKVGEVKGTQITGVTVSDAGSVFVNAPNWRDGVQFAVAKLINNKFVPFPNNKINSCVAESDVKDNCFLAVQSVVAHGDRLYILDTRNPQFKGVVDAPRIFVVDLHKSKVENVLKLSNDAYHQDSYINDLRVDNKTNRIYMTDSNHAGIVVYNLNDGTSYRVLDNHVFTKSEVNKLDIKGVPFIASVHSDGIALDRTNDTLYFHALTGYSLYAINTSAIVPGLDSEIEKNVRLVAKTGAPDGMLYHNGVIYLADLERNLIQYLTPSLDLRTLVSGDKVSWADTFSVYKGNLYYTNSKIHLAGEKVDDMTFEVFKVPLPNGITY
ncbi:L-dopachrome tautomerase-related protein [Colwellia sp. E2M01]|uniref:L-dopachrome tautomerase-related protein n=1 Tax=Colwellia sp. E2M01 TaxID=2841561 RepID=UPI001C0974A5|nr:L-dopachrome tautomerase-related protein [Colwellia sp. E2M01]MBU2870407.1 hypothetical protein [Colwellia sp. E2M01]